MDSRFQIPDCGLRESSVPEVEVGGFQVPDSRLRLAARHPEVEVGGFPIPDSRLRLAARHSGMSVGRAIHA